jgi:hypothetical protein
MVIKRDDDFTEYDAQGSHDPIHQTLILHQLMIT